MSMNKATWPVLIAALSMAACGGGSSTVQKTADSGQDQETVAMPADYLGANLPGITDYSFTPVYVDLVNQARVFGPPDHPWGGSTDIVPVGSDGWPTGDFGIFLMTRPGMAGTYKASFTGKADVSLNGSFNTTLANLSYNAALNRTTFDVVRGPNTDGAQMVLQFRDTQLNASSPKGSGIKDLKVIRPGYDALNPPLFTPEFMQHISRFKVLRFMDWLRTNGNPTVRWSERSTLQTHYMSDAGVPWEHVIALANLAKKDIWINIPAGADDYYVLQLARLMKSTLNPDSRIYVEYSNELWNGGFSQYGVNRDLAARELYNDPGSRLAYDGNTQVDVLTYRRIAKRGKEISDIFRSVYGDAAMMATVRPVFASQVVQTYLAQLGLDFINEVYGPPARYFYAYAGAPYLNLGRQQTVDGLDSDAVLQAMNDSLGTLARGAYFEKNMAFASWYGLRFFAYEGGTDTFGPGSIAAKKAASLDPRLLDICKRYLRNWYAAGGELFMWFTAGAGNWDTQYGTWELTTDLSLTDTPKIQCIDQTLSGLLPARQARNLVPGSFDALAYLENYPDSIGNYAEATKGAVKWLHPGSYLDYLIYAPRAGSHQLVITAAAERGNSIDVMLNTKTLATDFGLAAHGLDQPVANAAIPLTLPQGFSTLRIRTRTEGGGFVLSQFTVR